MKPARFTLGGTQPGDGVAREPVGSAAAASCSPSQPHDTRTLAFDFADLHRRCLGHIELAARLLASFEQRFGVELAEIENKLAANDRQGATRLVHQLKGAAGNVSAVRLRQVLEQLEFALRSEQTGSLDALHDQLAAEWKQFIDSARETKNALMKSGQTGEN